MIFADQPRIPRNRWGPWAGLACVLGYFALFELVQPSERQTLTAIVALYGALFLLGLVSAVRGRLELRRHTAVFRMLSDASRSQLLSGLRGEPADPLFEREMSWHGRPEVDGLIERFTSSPVDQREARTMAIAAWGTAIALALTAAVARLTVSERIGLAVLAAGAAVMSAAFRRRLEKLSRSFEVSPFGFSEVAGTRVRRVLWGMPLVLRNNKEAKQLEVSVAGAAGSIDIPYTVVQLERLAALIVEKGDLSSDR